MKFKLKNYKTEISLGIYQIEKLIKNKILVTVEFEYLDEKSQLTDNINDTIDYDNIVEQIIFTADKKHYNLIEHFIYSLNENILTLDEKIKDLKISVKKLSAIKNADYIEITNS